ncbi:MAG: tRNA (adenosine(37)-N6)-threonylcarbamoyltransferase complex dimerization subunit type 1 TsaB [Acidobacteria bacterium]|nr:tRNA (adenosine(37)-N6)-threonylcarbamoyltransferase complex dimerization subunit type 1 TsaB [Acidobacteriota bacterium]
MRLLALDTTSEHGSVALLEYGQVVATREMHEEDGYSAVIFGVIAELLARVGWKLSDLDCFAGATGPGSFTGVRVCLTAVKGLAEANGRPAVGVSNLQALASLGNDAVRAPWIDAHRGEVYSGLYDARGHALRPEAVAPREEWQAQLDPETEAITGEGVALASPIGRIAYGRWRAGERPDPASLEANYVRRSDAELFSTPAY